MVQHTNKLLFAFSFIFFVPFLAQAEPLKYAFLAPLPGFDDPNLIPYLISLVKFLIGVAGVIAVIKLVLCGFELLVFAVASKREAAKECLWKVVLGLLLILSAYVLLESINPDLNRPKLELPETGQVEGYVPPPEPGVPQGGPTCPAGATCVWSTGNTLGHSCRDFPKCTPLVGKTRQTGQDTACGGAKPAGADCCVYAPAVCSNCVTITAPVKNGNQANVNIAGKLNDVWNSWMGPSVQGTLPWRVTEAFPNTQAHCSNAEAIGTSVDVNFVGAGAQNVLIQNIGTFAKEAAMRGMRVEYEVSSPAELNRIQTALQAAGFRSVVVKLVPGITAHFSVYN